MKGTLEKGLEFSHVAHTPNSLNAGAGWTDWDLSALVPAYCTVAVMGMQPQTNWDNVGVRAKGSAVDTKLSLATGYYTVMLCGLPSSKIVQLYDASAVGGHASQYLYMGAF